MPHIIVDSLTEAQQIALLKELLEALPLTRSIDIFSAFLLTKIPD